MEVPAGQVNIRGGLPCLASNVLEPMLHPFYCDEIRNLPQKDGATKCGPETTECIDRV